MKYEYTREHMMPIVMELTYEDLQLIQRVAKCFLDMEEKPEGIWAGDMRKLEREAREAMDKVSSATAYAFPKTTE
jgi:hypothetical protein